MRLPVSFADVCGCSSVRVRLFACARVRLSLVVRLAPGRAQRAVRAKRLRSAQDAREKTSTRNLCACSSLLPPVWVCPSVCLRLSLSVGALGLAKVSGDSLPPFASGCFSPSLSVGAAWFANICGRLFHTLESTHKLKRASRSLSTQVLKFGFFSRTGV